MYKKKETSWLKHLDFTILDILIQQGAFWLSFYIRHFSDEDRLIGQVFLDYYQRMAVVLVLIDLFVVFFSGTYNGILKRNKYQEIRSVVVHATIMFGAALAYIFLMKQSEFYSRQVLYCFWGIDAVAEYFGRCTLKRIVRRRILTNRDKSIMVAVTDSSHMRDCVAGLANSRYTQYVLTGLCVIDDNLTGTHVDGIPVVAGADDFMEYIRDNVVDEVFLENDNHEFSQSLANELVEYGLTVHSNLGQMSKYTGNRLIEPCGGFMVATTSMRIASSRQIFLKRLMDIIGSIIGLVFTGIAFIIFAPIIKIQSPGPVFFKQTRIGLGGRPFKFYKFRSMYVDADKRKEELRARNEIKGLMFKMENDPRIIPIGHFMRKYSIDELPQFWNVLKGNMSLVGTRPPTTDEFSEYELHHKARLSIKPGLTGMWQVSGRSDVKDFEDVVALDTEYISNWSLGLDIKILFKTVKVVLTGSGSK